MADYTVTAANVLAGSNATFDYGTAGETITAGMPVYKDSTDGNRYKKAINSSAAAAAVVGISLHAATDEQPLKIQTSGDINMGTTLTVGQVVILSNTAGLFRPDADSTSTWFKTVLGVTTTASNLKLGIVASGVQVP